MRILYSAYLFIILNSVLPETLRADKVDNSNEFCSAAKREEELCGSYTFKVVKPLLGHLNKIQEKLNNKDEKIEEQQFKLKELQQHLSDYDQKDKSIEFYKTIDASNSAQIVFLRETVRQLSQSCQLSKNDSAQVTELNQRVAVQSETIKKQNDQLIKFRKDNDLNAVKMRDCELEFERQSNLIRQRDELFLNLQTQKKKLNETQIQIQDYEVIFAADSCIPFANYPGMHSIKVPGIDPFNVLCQSAASGHGWIVIQQRINGKEDFYRDWVTYRNGFGSFDGDFFLGLEKIYRLTSNKRHELFIHLERFNERMTYATYDDFAISGEDDQYKLIRVEGYSGNTETADFFGYTKDNYFYTVDRDNEFDCAKKKHGGWWYSNCAKSNLNGKYFDREVVNITANYWYGELSLKKIQMLIRPKA